MSETRWMVKGTLKGYPLHVFKASELPSGYWETKAVCGGVKPARLFPAFAPEEITRDEASRMAVGRDAQGFDVCKQCLASAKKYIEGATGDR